MYSMNCHGFWMVPVGFYLIFGSAVECVHMVRQSQHRDVTWPALLGCAGVMLAAVVPVYWPLFGSPYPANCQLGTLGWPIAAMLIAQFMCIAWTIPSYQPGQQTLAQAVLAGWIAVYFGGCFAFAIALRLTGSSGWGLYLLVGIIVITKFADSGAYFVGRAVGRTKLCPQVSPGKTVEGLLGGMATATLAGWIYFCWCAPIVFVTNLRVPFLSVLVLGVVLTLAGVLGDLVESIFKREMGCKDSGKLLPGLGGLWDVSDSLLPAFVVGYLVVVAELIEGPVS